MKRFLIFLCIVLAVCEASKNGSSKSESSKSGSSKSESSKSVSSKSGSSKSESSKSVSSKSGSSKSGSSKNKSKRFGPCISSVPDQIRRDGYTPEEHKVVTTDGYILTLHRVLPRCSSTANNRTAGVALLMHGLFFSSADWVLLGRSNALGYYLADECYDVWLINFRGTDLSRRHTTLNPRTSSKYWDFCWHEMGVHDLPAAVNYITTNTGQARIYGVCHSQGCTAAFVGAIYNPQLNTQIRYMSAMAPGVYISQTRNHYLRRIEIPNYARNGPYFGFSLKEYKEVHGSACNGPISQWCGIALAYGLDLSGTNRTVIPRVPCHTPSGISVKQLYHFHQLIRRGVFEHYDYGALRNRAEYGNTMPPRYDLSKVRYPVVVWSSQRDRMVVTADARRTCNWLGNCNEDRVVNRLGHYDFLYGVGVRDTVYRRILEDFRRN